MPRELIQADRKAADKIIDRDKLYDDVPVTEQNGFYSEYYLDAETFYIEITCGEMAFCKWKGLQFPVDYERSPHTVITAPQSASDLVLRTIDPVPRLLAPNGRAGELYVLWLDLGP